MSNSDDLDAFQVSRLLQTKEMMRDVSGIDTYPLFTSTMLTNLGLFERLIGDVQGDIYDR